MLRLQACDGGCHDYALPLLPPGQWCVGPPSPWHSVLHSHAGRVGAHALTVWSVAGNVCTDWRLTHDLTTSLKTAGSGTARVNTKAFEMFLNPSFKGAEAGSCQGLGFKDKQLKFAAYVKSPSSAAASSVHAFL